MDIWRVATCGHGLHRSSVGLTPLVRLVVDFVVQQAVQQNPAANRKCTTNPQHFDMSRCCTTNGHPHNKSTTRLQQIEQLYNKSETFRKTLQVVVHQIHNKSHNGAITLRPRCALPSPSSRR